MGITPITIMDMVVDMGISIFMDIIIIWVVIQCLFRLAMREKCENLIKIVLRHLEQI